MFLVLNFIGSIRKPLSWTNCLKWILHLPLKNKSMVCTKINSLCLGSMHKSWSILYSYNIYLSFQTWSLVKGGSSNFLCALVQKLKQFKVGGWQIGGFCKWVEMAGRGYETLQALSPTESDLIYMWRCLFIVFLCCCAIVCIPWESQNYGPYFDI